MAQAWGLVLLIALSGIAGIALALSVSRGIVAHFKLCPSLCPTITTKHPKKPHRTPQNYVFVAFGYLPAFFALGSPAPNEIVTLLGPAFAPALSST